MGKIPSWETNCHPGSQKISGILRNPKVHYSVHKSSPVVPILSQKSSVQLHMNPSNSEALRNISYHSCHLRSGVCLPLNPQNGGPSLGRLFATAYLINSQLSSTPLGQHLHPQPEYASYRCDRDHLTRHVVIGRFEVQISVRRPAILTEVLVHFLSS
jgi:hypothetical protein